MSKIVRDTKFRHTICTLGAREEWYDQLRVANTPSDNAMIAASSSFVGYVDGSAAGSSCVVLPISSIGKNHIPITARAYQIPVIRAHSQPLQDLDFDPFNPNSLLTVAPDGHAKYWRIPEEGLVEDLSMPMADISSAQPLFNCSFNPVAEGVASIRTSRLIRVVDLASQTVRLETEAVPADIQCTSWSWRGESVACASKDKAIRLFDFRSSSSPSSTTPNAHESAKTFRVSHLGSSELLLSIGHTITQDREMCLWDARNMSACVSRERIDSSLGMIMPMFDADLNLLVLAGRGDTNMRLYELTEGRLYPIGNNVVGDMIKGSCFFAKKKLSLMDAEVMRVLKLCETSIQPVSFRVPRRERLKFQDDLYPPTVYGVSAALTADAWFAGGNIEQRPTAVVAPPDASSSRGPSVTGYALSSADSDGSAAAAAGDEPVVESAESKARTEELKQEEKEFEQKVAGIRNTFASRLRFRFVRGKENQKDKTFYNLRPSMTVSDTAMIVSNDHYWAVPWAGTGGPIYVSRIGRYGKVEPECSLINGHKAQVLDLAFSPFSRDVLASSSDDTKIKIWRIPDDYTSSNRRDTSASPAQGADDAIGTLSGHMNGVRSVEFHPTVSSVLVSSSTDCTIRTWDVSRQAQVACFSDLTDPVTNTNFSLTGSLLAAASRDRRFRIFDARTAAAVSQSPEGGRGIRVCWCTKSNDQTDPIATVGAGPGGMRELYLWDIRNMSSAVCTRQVDHGTGQLFMAWDEDTGCMFLTGKSDTSIRMFEIEMPDGAIPANATKSSDYQSTSGPLLGISLLPKRVVNVRAIEVACFLRLTNDAVNPLSFTLPRTADVEGYFQDDIYVPTRSPEARLPSYDDWLADTDRNLEPYKISLKPEDMTTLSQFRKQEEENAPKVMKGLESIRKIKDEMKADDDYNREKKESLNRMQNLAVTRSKYHTDANMGSRQGVDRLPDPKDAAVADDEW